MIRIDVDWCDKGSPACFRPVLDQIIKQFPEMTMQRTHREAFKAICEATESLDQWCEITYRDPYTGRIAAFMILTDDDDDHVGPVMGVQWCWSSGLLTQGAMLRMHRKAREVTRAANYKVMAYTKRLAEARYEIKYVKV